MKVITELYFSVVPHPNCILTVVLKNHEPKFLYIFAVLPNLCFKESCFPDIPTVPVIKYVGGLGRGQCLKTTTLLVSCLWLVYY